MQTTSDRINQRMRDLGLQHKDLVAATGASKGTVTNWINGVNNPTGKRLVQLAQALKTTSSWLLTGNSTPEFTQVEPWDSNTPLDDDEVEIPFFKDFSFACGGGSIGEAIANETRKLRMSKATLRNLSIMKENAVAATAIGDSMSPTIKDGDTIHVDLGRKNIKDGKIFAICLGGLFYCKRLYNLPLGGVRIVSDNSVEFPEIHLNAQEIIDQQLEVIGWVWQISSLESW
ncbi:S24 family peptidase [Acinetobacter baumannii]|uniref:S24 family peptidase n=1 Tax=Acinetobacter baumannii TaxID=470 RepID=UPI0010CBD5A6|nr:helix-turn-helix transcriptional regulator [Acinetobacter baumannii]TKV52698.1 helix-turn-helix transcriptional regulator [Acinetobacter baumannii]TKV53138.1 helix-turn-helix transcriptional regulator [Acinetobacter baumannii]HCT6227323.1 helix-turn-helix transcriptional regulator [Acinetobacter baumannii]HEN9568487.1 helix-turn-helix transcriptional regulator [Acinetobacter baumannii]HEO1832465.1 helix-turn-helix transcriptional regulator [Acinetobacter baumannii]